MQLHGVYGYSEEYEIERRTGTRAVGPHRPPPAMQHIRIAATNWT